MTFIEIFICIIAGAGAGLATGLAGLSAATVISPMLIVFISKFGYIDPYIAVGIALASDVLASGISALIYKKNNHVNIKDGLILLVTVLVFTILGSYIADFINLKLMGTFSVFVTFLVGLKFLIKPVVTSPEARKAKSKKRRVIESLICGIVIGFTCGFVGAGGGMMMLLALTLVLGYDLKTAVGTSVFVMTFTALFGAISHFTIIIGQERLNDYRLWICLAICIVSTFVFSQIASLIANKVSTKKLNLIVGIVLTLLGIAVIIVNFINIYGNKDEVLSLVNNLRLFIK